VKTELFALYVIFKCPQLKIHSYEDWNTVAHQDFTIAMLFNAGDLSHKLVLVLRVGCARSECDLMALLCWPPCLHGMDQQRL
jgi:hypothetical protein